MRAELNTDPPGGSLVETLVPCPYCAKSNRVTIVQEQVSAVIVHRGGAAVDLSRPDALREQVFDGQEP